MDYRLRVNAEALLLTDLEEFAATVSAGNIGDYTSSLPSLNAIAASGSRPWDPTAAAAAIGATDFVLDWASMMDYDPVTKRYFVSGGRPARSDTEDDKLVPKLVIFDEVLNEVSAVDAWAPDMLAGHIYRSTTVLTGPQLVAYHPNASMSGLGSRIWLWDIVNEEYYGYIPTPPTNLAGGSGTWTGNFLCWLPTIGTEGGIIMADADDGRIAWFDWADRASGASAWKTMTPNDIGAEWSGGGKYHLAGHYHPVTDKVLMGCSYGSSKLAIVEPDATIALTEFACPANVSCSGGEGGPFMPHPTLPISILLDRSNHHFWTYDWRLEGTGVTPWTDQGLAPTELQSDYLIGLPHPSGGGFLFHRYGSAGTSAAYYWKPDYS